MGLNDQGQLEFGVNPVNGNNQGGSNGGGGLFGGLNPTPSTTTTTTRRTTTTQRTTTTTQSKSFSICRKEKYELFKNQLYNNRFQYLLCLADLSNTLNVLKSL